MATRRDVVDVVELRCHACQTLQTEPRDACVSLRDQMPKVRCLFCRCVGMMRKVHT